MTTELEQLRAAWKSTIHGDGGACPCCDRFGKVYARAINETMAKSLQWLYNKNNEKGLREWIDVPNSAGTEVLRTNQLSTLRWWGLVERMTPPPDEKKNKTKHSGMWRITLKGMDFVEGRTTVPRQVFTYNADVVGFSEDITTYEQCKDRHFNLKQTMEQTYKEGEKALHGAGDKPVKLDVSKCNLPVGQAEQKVDIEETLAAAKTDNTIRGRVSGYWGVPLAHRGIFANAPV